VRSQRSFGQHEARTRLVEGGTVKRNGRTVNVGLLLRENAVLDGKRKVFLRVSHEATVEAVHRIADNLIPEVARIAAERADARGSKTVQLVDVLDAFALWRRP